MITLFVFTYLTFLLWFCDDCSPGMRRCSYFLFKDDVITNPGLAWNSRQETIKCRICHHLTHDCSRIHLASWTRSRRRINRRHRGITSSNHFWFCLPTSSLISHHIHRTSQTRVYWSFLKKYGTSAHTLGCKPPIPSQIGTVGAFVELSLAGVDDEVEASFWTSLVDFVALLLVMAMVFQHLLYPAP